MNEANELGYQTDEFEERESGYNFDCITKVTIKTPRYYAIRTTSFSKISKPFSIQTVLYTNKMMITNVFCGVLWLTNKKKINTVKAFHILQKNILRNLIKVICLFQGKILPTIEQ